MRAPGSLQAANIEVGSHVFIHGLRSEAGAQLNFKSGRVVQAEEDGRWGVQVLTGPPKRVRRMNLLNASCRYDRELFLGLLTLHHAPELRVVRPALDAALNEDIGLLLLVTDYVRHPRTCLFQFGGYMGQLWDEHWCYSDPAKALALSPKPAPRLDAACSDMGLGRVLFAGGCGKHPRQCEEPYDFYKSAEIYDSLTDEWFPISDMPTRRHGATACKLGTKVYVLGGQYVDTDRCIPEEEKFCDVLDIHTAEWSSLPRTLYSHIQDIGIDLDDAAFFGAGTTGGRLVALLDGMTIAFNPASEHGWRAVHASTESIRVGRSSCATTYNGELVVASGRPVPFAKSVAAFSFSSSADDPYWFRGSWRQLPDLSVSRVGASIAVVYGRLYITGGVDEETGEFYKDAERLDGDEWVRVSWFEMPRALHAHDNFALPYLLKNRSPICS